MNSESSTAPADEHDPSSRNDPPAPSATEHPRRIGPDIPGYEIVQELGRGGMGVVYKARQLTLNRTVALKMVLAGEHASDRIRARFLAEAEIAANLQHANIIPIYELGDVEGLPYITMEFVDGAGLESIVPKLRADYHAVAGFFEKLARAAHWAHQHSVVHRDLKPANILIGPDEEPKIADFGLAKRLDPTGLAAGLTRSGEQMGTPSYMAPEQAYPEFGEIGPATDVYSLGVMLYEILAGSLPITGDSHAKILSGLKDQDPSSPSWLHPGLPRDLETICMKCLRKRPAERYSSAEALAEDLRRFQNGEPILAKPPTPLTLSIRWVRRHRLSALLLCLGAAAAVAGVLATRHAYLYVWEYAEDYRNFAKRHGSFIGVGTPLTSAEVARRNGSWNIVRAGRRGRILRCAWLSADGKPNPFNSPADALIPGLLDNLPNHRKPCRFEFRYNADGTIGEERMLDAEGFLLTRFRYSYPDGYEPGKPQPGFIQGDFVDEDSLPMALDSGLSSVQLARDADGREHRLFYADNNGNPKTDRHGSFGKEVVYGPENVIREFRCLNEEGALQNNTQGWAVRRVTWDSHCNPVEVSFWDSQGEPAASDGVHLILSEYDSYGNQIRFRALALDGATPARNQESGHASETLVRIDKHGRTQQLLGLGYDPAVMGFARAATDLHWKDDGVTLIQSFTDENGLPARCSDAYFRPGYQRSQEELDLSGRTIRQRRDGYDPAEKGYFREVETLEWSEAKANFPSIKQRSVIAYQAEDGAPAYDSINGNSEYTRIFDAWGRPFIEILSGLDPSYYTYDRLVVESDYPDLSRRTTRRFPRAVETSTEDSSLLSMSRFDSDPAAASNVARHPLASHQSMSLAEADYVPVKRFGRYLGPGDEPKPSPSGNTQWSREYDAASGTIVETHTGYDEAEYPYSRVVITSVWIDGAENPADPNSLVVRATWDYFNAAGLAVRNEEGYLQYIEERDASNVLTRLIKKGYEEESEGHFTEIIAFSQWQDGVPRKKQWTYQNSSGDKIRYRDGFFDYSETYDEQGQVVEIAISGYDPERFPWHAQITRSEGSAGGRRLIGTWLDAEGNRQRGPSGEWEQTEELRPDGEHRLRQTWTGYDEPHNGFASVILPYDEEGQPGQAQYLSSTGTPIEGLRMFVRFVVPGLQAARLGLQPGDAILNYNGRPVRNSMEWIHHIELTGGSLEYLRGNKVMVAPNVEPGLIGIFAEDRVVPAGD